MLNKYRKDQGRANRQAMSTDRQAMSTDRQAGFTLIELLIVIVIIGILSGVLIAVINPVRQQNRSRNAAIKAATNKVAFAISTARAGIGRLPYNSELLDELENISINADGGTTCNTANQLGCVFSLAGTKLPSTCTSSYGGHSPTGSQCYFYVVSPNPQSASFRIIGKKYRLNPGATITEEAPMVYVFDSSNGFYECSYDSSPGATDASGWSLDVANSSECYLVGEEATSGGNTT